MLTVVRRESLRHREAFDYFLALGPTRSFRQVADVFGVSHTAVASWHKSFGWGAKVAAAETEIAATIDRETKASIVRQRENIVTVIGALIDGCIKTMTDGTIAPTFQIESTADFERVVKLYQLMNGEATERQEVNADFRIDAREAVLSRLGRLYAARETASLN